MLDWLKPDRDHERRPSLFAADAVVALVFLWITVESLRSSAFVADNGPIEGVEWILALSPTALLILRRWAPLTTMLTATGLLLLASAFWSDSNAPLAIPFFAYSVALTRPLKKSAWLVGATAACLSLRVLYGPGDEVLLAVPVTFLLYAIGWLVGVSIRRSQERAGQFADEAEEWRIHASQVAEQAVADERARIARELHDAVGHAVNVMVMQAGAARLSAQEEKVTRALQEIERVGRSALSDLDRMLGLLQDAGQPIAPLEPTRTTADIEALIEETRAGGVDIHFHNHCTEALEHAMDLPAGAAVYRIVQESLTNALKHAGPARIDVNLECTDDDLEITVRDDGLGHSASRRSTGGRGIAGMTERANVLGGRLTAHPLPEGGFCVTATIPRRLEHHRYATAPADRSRQ